MTCFKWAWRHHSVIVDQFDTLDEAIRASLAAAEYGTEALWHIEVIDKDGSRLVDQDSPEYEAIEAENDAAWERAFERGKNEERFVVEVRAPEKAQRDMDYRWASVAQCSDAAAAAVLSAELATTVGADRVRVRHFVGAQERRG